MTMYEFTHLVFMYMIRPALDECGVLSETK